MRGPLTGVQFAAWGGMFSTIDCTMVALRKKVGVNIFIVVEYIYV